MLRVSLFTSLACLTVAWEWDSPVSSGAPSPRIGHSMTIFTPSNGQPRMISCGGTADASGTQFSPPGCVSLDPFNQWTFTPVVGANDTAPRVDHTAVIVEGYMVIYGGIIQPNATGSFSPTDCEVISVGVWKPAPGGGCGGGDVPVARWGHTAVLWQATQWIVFGGATLPQDTQPPIDLNDIIILDLTGLPGPMKWVTPTGILNPPPARHYHAAGIYGNSMFIYGGYSISATDSLDDLWMVAIDGFTAFAWALLQPTGGPVIALYGHRGVIVNSLFILYGGHISVGSGIHSIDLADGGALWSAPEVDGEWSETPYRAAVAAFYSDGDSDPELVVFGGGKENGGLTTNGIAVLSQIGTNIPPASQELPFILAGAACGAFLLLALGFFAFRRSRTLAVKRRRDREQNGMDVNIPLLKPTSTSTTTIGGGGGSGANSTKGSTSGNSNGFNDAGMEGYGSALLPRLATDGGGGGGRKGRGGHGNGNSDDDDDGGVKGGGRGRGGGGNDGSIGSEVATPYNDDDDDDVDEPHAVLRF